MKLLYRLFLQFLDGMAIGQQFTMADFQDYVRMFNPRLSPSSGEIAFLAKICPNVKRNDKIGRWVSYVVVSA